eukprot:TRINITY_DN1070_c0_g2_i1.p2 TRINITY_DN1070_c0_g2~~TRINITY_DN1070_c0_g2_i1.p2  ORF type:complete len:298 (+),score=78.38 TRINITY_DN1070_c0_g2_i1:78-896(+)
MRVSGRQVALGCLLAAPGLSHALKPKRGYVVNKVMSCNEQRELNNIGWYYSYTVADKYRKEGLPGNCEETKPITEEKFVPMYWCMKAFNDTVHTYVNRSFLLGFNEPNNQKNCNSTPRELALAWSTVMRKWPNSTLVSPATSGHGAEYYKQFFGNCSQLYGKEGCRISHLATHCYSCNSNHTMEYLQSLYDLFGLPIWLTEFSCQAGGRNETQVRHLEYMKEIVPILDASPIIYRYAWMAGLDHDHDPEHNRGLFNKTTDQLTELGRVYNSL